MFSLAGDLAARAARLVAADHDEPRFWFITTRGSIVGSLTSARGTWRLAWFESADPRLINYAGPVDGDLEALAQALSLRLGAPVRLRAFSG